MALQRAWPPHEVGALRRQDVLDLVNQLPDVIVIEDLMYRLYVIRKIELGEAAIAAGDVLTEEEVDQEIESWFAHDGQDQLSTTSTTSGTG